MTQTAFNPQDHILKLERKSKKKDSQGRDTWITSVTEYLPVAWRLYWFRLDNPKGRIDSHHIILDLDKGAAVFESYVEREDGGNARMHGSETVSDWKDYIEKAQTKSLGRALAAVGYGSQFTDDEFAEGERIVDSPVERPHMQSVQPVQQATGQKEPDVQLQAAPTMESMDQANLPINSNQLNAIKSICASLGRTVSADVQTLTYLKAKSVIQTLTAELNERKQKQQSNRAVVGTK